MRFSTKEFIIRDVICLTYRYAAFLVNSFVYEVVHHLGVFYLFLVNLLLLDFFFFQHAGVPCAILIHVLCDISTEYSCVEVLYVLLCIELGFVNIIIVCVFKLLVTFLEFAGLRSLELVENFESTLLSPQHHTFSSVFRFFYHLIFIYYSN